MSNQAAAPTSPSRKQQQLQPASTRGGLAAIAGIASPKFSCRAALVQHKSKLSKPGSSSTQDADLKGARGAASSIPSLSRGRFNSTDTAPTSTLPRPRAAATSPSACRPSSSLGKRGVDDSTSITDFGAFVQPKAPAINARLASTNASAPVDSASTNAKSAKLRGPPFARTQWAPPAPKTLPSPSSSKASRKIARSDGVAEVHAGSPAATAHPTGGAIPRSRTMSAASRTIAAPHSQLHRPKIGTLPKPKPKPAPVRTILDERYESSASDTDDDEQDLDELDGPDVSRIRTKRINPPAQPRLSDGASVSSATTRGASRIPSIGSSSTRTLPRPHRRSSSNSLLSKTTDEKENTSIPAPTHSKRHSISASSEAAPVRARSSLPLAPAQPAQAQQEPKEPTHTTPSPAKSASLSALRSRGLQPGSIKAARPAPRHDLGIKTSIIHANPAHPSIAALQAKTAPHQPISTPEALVKAKKRLSGAIFPSASSSTLHTLASNPSPSVRAAGSVHSPSLSKLPAHKKSTKPHTVSAATITPSPSATSALPRSESRSPIKSSLLLFPSVSEPVAGPSKDEHASSPSKQVGADVASIDADLLASLRVVAHKANLQLSDLLDASPHGAARYTRQASEELEALAGDVSVDLMALDLAASPSSDTSMLRSPPIAADTPAAPQPASLHSPASEVAPAIDTTPALEPAEDTDTSLASPSLRAAARHRPAIEPNPVPETPVRRTLHSGSVATTPFASCGKAPPATMSARSRTRLKRALRESLGLEAHFAALNLASRAPAAPLRDEAASPNAASAPDARAALLTDDDLDDIVSAVASIHLHDLGGDAGSDEVRPASPCAVGSEVAELQAAQRALAVELEQAQSRESALAAQLEEQRMAAARMQREHERLHSDLSSLRAYAAGVEWKHAQTAWASARAEALAELQDAKVAADTMMLLTAHLGLCQSILTASIPSCA